jgi:hypothetical protein
MKGDKKSKKRETIKGKQTRRKVLKFKDSLVNDNQIYKVFCYHSRHCIQYIIDILFKCV